MAIRWTFYHARLQSLSSGLPILSVAMSHNIRFGRQQTVVEARVKDKPTMMHARSTAVVAPANSGMMKLSKAIVLAGLVSAGLALSGCGDPYSPGQRAVGGGLLGAGGGAALGAIAGGGQGAAIGALAGGALGAAGGAATTPSRPRYNQPQPSGYNGY